MYLNTIVLQMMTTTEQNALQNKQYVSDDLVLCLVRSSLKLCLVYSLQQTSQI